MDNNVYKKKFIIYYDKLENFTKSILLLAYYKLRYKELTNLIKLNKEFENIHKGKRCFVIGNGPSLKEQDLSLLENEYVFTVNQIVRNPDFKKIKTNYHFWADPVFFDLSPDKPEDLELLEVFKGVNTEDNKPICFLPTYAYDFVKKFILDKELNIRYYKVVYKFHDGYNKRINFTKFIPGFYTVVQYAIAMAIYMGFSKIYLLGCDTTGIITTINTALKTSNIDTYAYDITENERKRLENQLKVYDMEECFNGWSKILHLYKTLNDYCKKRNIKLINCSSKTIIDSIVREKYEDVILRKQN